MAAFGFAVAVLYSYNASLPEDLTTGSGQNASFGEEIFLKGSPASVVVFVKDTDMSRGLATPRSKIPSTKALPKCPWSRNPCPNRESGS